MITVTTVKALKDNIQQLKSGERQVVGFVPTMGALHEGHLSLVKTCKMNSHICVVSIFVNPTQFNNPQDLENYPRMPEKDMSMLEAQGVDIVFLPQVDEMYPEEDKRVFDFGSLETVMEGKFRPGHFNGVAQIVSKLFDTVEPDKAFFGEKDFQQLAIIKAMVKKLNYSVEIVPCSTIRENDGLAMSSRNLLLSESNRTHAPIIYKMLQQSVNWQNQLSVNEVKERVTSEIKTAGFEPEYFEIVNADTLQPIETWDEEGSKAGCIAVYAGKVRLIDNIRYQ